MHAICLDATGIHYREDQPQPQLAEGEVLIDVIQAGICETDLQLAQGYMNFRGILGHEFIGIARSGSFEGQRVVGEINCNCRHCLRCQTGLGNHCANRTVVGILGHHGAFAEQVAIPQTNLHKVPDDITNDQAVLIEPLAAALEITTQVDLAHVQSVAILGDGRLAFLCALVLGRKIDRTVVIGKHPQKLERFQKLGLETQQLGELKREKSFELVVDCTGSVTGLPLALELVQPRGTVVMKTTVAEEHNLSLASIVIDEVSLLGSRCGPFDLAIEMLSAGCFDIEGLITHRFPLKKVEEAFCAAKDTSAFKVVFDLSLAATE